MYGVYGFALWAGLGAQWNSGVAIAIDALEFGIREDHLLHFTKHFTEPDTNRAGQLELHFKPRFLTAALKGRNVRAPRR
jgi:hypothetical protein